MASSPAPPEAAAQQRPDSPATPTLLPGSPSPLGDYKRRPSRLPTQRKIKKFVRPPSLGHKDVEPPSLLVVQRSLTSYLGDGIQRPKSKYEKERTEFHDEEGRMLLTGSAGGRYAGEVLGGAPHGHGEHINFISKKNPDHLIYEGEWEYGRKTGYGVAHYTNGQEYKGELVDGEHSGWGCLRYNNGNIYDGEWFKGRRHGQGTLYYQNGNWYDGGWCKDAREGWGVFYWPKIRRRFEGEWACNDPFSGCYSAMTPQEYELLEKRKLEFPPTALGVLEKGVPNDNLELLLMDLRHPFETNYVPVSTIRKCKDEHNPSKYFRTQVQRSRSLSTDQLEALKHAYQAIAPGYLYRPIFLAVHLRRLLVIARIDPDLPQGQKLLTHLEQCANKSAKRNSSEVIGFTYSDFLFSIYRFHDP